MIPKTGAEIIAVLRVDWGGSLTRWYADRDIQIGTIQARGRISRVGEITREKSSDGLTSLGNASVELLDADQELLKLQEEQVFEFSPAKLYLNVVGESTLHEILVGEIGSPVEWREDERILRIDVITNFRSEVIPIRKIDPDDGPNVPLCFGAPRLVQPALASKGHYNGYDAFKPDIRSGQGNEVYLNLKYTWIPVVGWWLIIPWEPPAGYAERAINYNPEEKVRYTCHQIIKQYGRRLWLAGQLINPWTGSIAGKAPRGECIIQASDGVRNYSVPTLPDDEESDPETSDERQLPTDHTKVFMWSGDYYEVDVFGTPEAGRVGSMWGKSGDAFLPFSFRYWSPTEQGFFCKINIGGRPTVYKYDGQAYCSVDAGERDPGKLMKTILETKTDLTPVGDWSATGWHVDFIITDDTDALSLCSRIAGQTGRAIQITGTQARLIDLTKKRSAAFTITDTEILEGTIKISSTTTETLAAAYHGMFRRGLAEEVRKITSRPGAFPSLKREEEISFDCMKRQDLVEHVLGWIANRRGRVWKLLTFETPLYRFDVSPFDVVKIETDQLDFSPVSGIVESISYDTDNFSIRWTVWLPIEQGTKVESANAWLDDPPAEDDDEPYPFYWAGWYDILQIDYKPEPKQTLAVITDEVTNEGAVVANFYGNGYDAEPTGRSAVIPTGGPRDWSVKDAVPGSEPDEAVSVPENPPGQKCLIVETHAASIIQSPAHQLAVLKEDIAADAEGLVCFCDVNGSEIGNAFLARNLGDDAEAGDYIYVGKDMFPSGDDPGRQRFFFLRRSGGKSPSNCAVEEPNLELTYEGYYVGRTIGGPGGDSYEDNYVLWSDYYTFADVDVSDVIASWVYIGIPETDRQVIGDPEQVSGVTGTAYIEAHFYNGTSPVMYAQFSGCVNNYTLPMKSYIDGNNPKPSGTVNAIRLKLSGMFQVTSWDEESGGSYTATARLPRFAFLAPDTGGVIIGTSAIQWL